MTDPANGKPAKSLAAAAALRAMGGWKMDDCGHLPRRAVCLAVPHTDNMDGLLLVLLAKSVGMPISWMVKDVWTKRPVIGSMVQAAGGVGVDRTKAHGLVGSMIEEFERRDDLYLVIPPEGTRSLTKHWKSGFYRIALGANVPVVPSYLDYANRRGGFGPAIDMTGDVKKDMDAIRAYYGDRAQGMAKYPDRFGPMVLREELDDQD